MKIQTIERVLAVAAAIAAIISASIMSKQMIDASTILPEVELDQNCVTQK